MGNLDLFSGNFEKYFLEALKRTEVEMEERRRSIRL